jgi:hypothetical protein
MKANGRFTVLELALTLRQNFLAQIRGYFMALTLSFGRELTDEDLNALQTQTVSAPSRESVMRRPWRITDLALFKSRSYCGYGQPSSHDDLLGPHAAPDIWDGDYIRRQLVSCREHRLTKIPTAASRVGHFG